MFHNMDQIAMAKGDASQAKGPLEGVKVLDCTHVMAGSFCTMILADLGADVVKIEPLAGEGMRRDVGGFRPFDMLNRNKRAIAVDFKSAEGADVLRRLALDADVWVENYRPGALDRAGLGYDTLSAINAQLVYCSISGFGLDGPYSDRAGLDLVAQAMSGVMSIVGAAGTPPASTGVPIADLNAGSFGAIGILAALENRRSTGQGQKVETSLLEAAMAYTIWESGLYLRVGEVAERRGAQHRLASPYEALQTGDGMMVVGVNNNGLWKRFCGALKAPDLESDPRFADPRNRLANREELRAELERRLATDSAETWTLRFAEAGVPAGPINTIDKALADPQVRARNMVVSIDGEEFVGNPIKFSRTPPVYTRGPSEVGEDTREVLSAHGFAADEIKKLAEAGVIGLKERGQEV